ncbi:dihydroneopterin aldolase [Thiomicrospira microaerophila]|uniref:dihydroneopterin aldolase n=1 Tax=Thiomicrospira microaerophila TaxID=406020 RepID=UPI00200CC097|nr:dihydroneopterin aldolase [Thiomicrospira microaerophila]UQB41650.1 dihydroneopterin aldolase [Thiomicrospira microaerophila]
MSQDCIYIEGLRIDCKIGVHTWEKIQNQPILLDLELYQSIQAAAVSDDLKDTLDYFSLSQQLDTLCQQNTYNLIETLAEQICSHIFAHYPSVETVKLKLNKPQALPKAQATGIKIRRQRTG